MASTVLVADDDLEILKLIVRILRAKGVNVLEATDGEEALVLAQKHHPDLMILDVMMPGRTGWEVCRAVREDDTLKDVRVLMLTGIGERLNEMTSPLYGADEYLDKPFDFGVLDTVIDKLLAP
jgi:DNA-binding response OmpR family regulator